jgi:hypothetical protein
MLELSIIKSFIKDRGVFESYYPKLKELALDKEIKILINTIYKYYNKYNSHNYISIDDLASFFKIQYPSVKNKELFQQLFNQLSALDTSDSVSADVIHCLLERDAASKIVNELIPIVQGQEFGKLAGIKETLERFEESIGALADDEEEEFVTQDLTALLAEESGDTGYAWHLDELQRVLGNIRGGVLGHIFAPPDTGKTTFIVDFLRTIARQFTSESDRALWINNEEAGKFLNLRLYSGVVGAEIPKIMGNKERAQELFKKYHGDQVYLKDEAGISILDTKQLIIKYKPKVVVIDIGDKVRLPTGGASPKHEQLKDLYIRYRELAKAYDVHILTTGQASATGYTKRWLAKEDMDNSKIGKPGELDYAIGVTGEEADPHLRYISVCKNKRGPYAKFMAGFHPEKARYENV